MADSGLERAIDLYHQALTDLIGGDPAPQKARFSLQDDICLANPFGPPVCGRRGVTAMLDRVASLYRTARPKEFERVATYASADLACIVEIERAWVTTGARQEAGEVVLRVTTVFRRETEGWLVVHRHADSITTPRPPESVVSR